MVEYPAKISIFIYTFLDRDIDSYDFESEKPRE